MEVLYIKCNEEKLKLVYEEGKKFLKEITAGILDDAEIAKYFNVEKTFKTKEEILLRLLGSLQNSQMKKNVIGLWREERQDIFRNILCDFDSKIILEKYDENTLYETFKNNFVVNRSESPNNLWIKYAKSVITACQFMEQFESAEKFDEYVESFNNNENELVKILSEKIFGLGFALSCDFLKELGYANYAKPDVHIKDIFTSLELCESEDDVSVFEAVIDMAKMVNDTPYNVDKIFWLISSGDFYKHNIKIGRNKDKFIEKMKQN